jgi:anti-anti-sigma factor
VNNHFHFEVRSDDRATVIAVRGELDLASAPALEEALNRAGDAGGLVILDLRELEFMDSTGLGLLVRTNQRAAESGVRFALVKGRQQVQRLLSLTGVGERLTVVDSPEELLGGN